MSYNLQETKNAIKRMGFETEAELINTLVRNCIREGAKPLDKAYKDIKTKHDKIEIKLDGERYWIVSADEGIATNILPFEEAYGYYVSEIKKGVELDDVEPFDPESFYAQENDDLDFRF